MKEKTKIVFIGASTFGLNCLQTITAMQEAEIVGVVTAPQAFSISYSPNKPVQNVLHADFLEFCKSNALPCYQIRENMREAALYDCLKTWSPDLMIVVGWYHLIPKSLRDLSKCGAIGFHASALPKYRGGAPLVWAMIQGESSAGISLFRMEDGVDTGDLIAQESVPILFRDTIVTLYKRIERTGLRILCETLPKYLAGNLLPRAQEDCGEKWPQWPQRTPADGRIDWRRSALDLYNFIRAQTKPYPGAFTFYRGRKVIIWKAYLHSFPRYQSKPGCFLQKTRKGIVIATMRNDTPLLITEYNIDGVIRKNQWNELEMGGGGSNNHF